MAANEAALQLFLSRPSLNVLYLDDRTTFVYAEPETALRAGGTPIPTNDVWIAALTLQHGLTLYTRDPHFNRRPQLAVF